MKRKRLGIEFLESRYALSVIPGWNGNTNSVEGYFLPGVDLPQTATVVAPTPVVGGGPVLQIDYNGQTVLREFVLNDLFRGGLEITTIDGTVNGRSPDHPGPVDIIGISGGPQAGAVVQFISLIYDGVQAHDLTVRSFDIGLDDRYRGGLKLSSAVDQIGPNAPDIPYALAMTMTGAPVVTAINEATGAIVASFPIGDPGTDASQYSFNELGHAFTYHGHVAIAINAGPLNVSAGTQPTEVYSFDSVLGYGIRLE